MGPRDKPEDDREGIKRRGCTTRSTTEDRVSRRPGRRGIFLSLVVPVYNEEEVLDRFIARVVPLLERVASDYEIICVNDGSTDGTLDALLVARSQNPNIKVIDLARNFGKEQALSAGLDCASGDAVIPIDVDLQDPPELIGEMVERWLDGSDMVVAVRRSRTADSLAKRGSANVFYRIIGRVADVPIPANAGDFRLLDRRVVEAFKLLPERTRFVKGMFAWLGFRQTTIFYDRPARAAGTGKWPFWRLWNFALEGIFSFTTLPLRIWTYFGLLVALSAMVMMLVVILRTLIMGIDVPGYASIVVMILFFSGLNMLGLGIIGEYLGRVFVEVKGRPLYIVRGAYGFDDPSREDTREQRFAERRADIVGAGH
jgi:polyisoprenyl-phosphate glycosyltransferase